MYPEAADPTRAIIEHVPTAEFRITVGYNSEVKLKNEGEIWEVKFKNEVWWIVKWKLMSKWNKKQIFFDKQIF